MPRICLANGDIKMHSLVAPTHFRIDRRGHGVAVGGHVVPFSLDAPNLIWLRVNHTGPCRWQNSVFYGFACDICRILRPHWTLAEVYGVGTVDHRVPNLSDRLHENSTFLFLSMPPLLSR